MKYRSAKVDTSKSSKNPAFIDQIYLKALELKTNLNEGLERNLRFYKS